MKLLLTCLSLLPLLVWSLNSAPVLEGGRVHPAAVYASQWCEQTFGVARPAGYDPLKLLWQISRKGNVPYANEPLFTVRDKGLRQLLDLPNDRRHFSYHELRYALQHPAMLQCLAYYHYLDGYSQQHRHTIVLAMLDGELRASHRHGRVVLTHIPTTSPWNQLEITTDLGPLCEPVPRQLQQRATQLTQLLNAIHRFEHPEQLFPMLPARSGEQWLPLSALTEDNRTQLDNPTYLELQQAYANDQPKPLGSLLLSIHSNTQRVRAERLYFQLPLHGTTLLLYALAALLVWWYRRIGLIIFFSAFSLHTMLLTWRIYILGRPPVANMSETVLWVAWVAAAAALLFYWRRRDRLILSAAGVAASGLLALLFITSLTPSFDNVQPVLASSYWLTIHVLMVVGSYGVLLIAALLGHLYLIPQDPIYRHCCSNCSMWVLGC